MAHCNKAIVSCAFHVQLMGALVGAHSEARAAVLAPDRRRGPATHVHGEARSFACAAWYALLDNSSFSLPSDSCIPPLYIATESPKLLLPDAAAEDCSFFFSKMRTWCPLFM